MCTARGRWRDLECRPRWCAAETPLLPKIEGLRPEIGAALPCGLRRHLEVCVC